MTAPVRSYPERLREHAGRIADVPAIVTPDVTLTYGALAGEVRALAGALRSRGIGPGGVVALTARGEIDHLLATLALFELGTPQLALASHDPSALRERLARRIGATLVLADRPDDAVAGLERLDLGAALASARAHPRGGPLPAVDERATAIYLTGSGTTGEPKILGFSQHQLALQAGNHINFAGERVLRPAHVEYNNSKRMRLFTLWQGGTCVLADGCAESLHVQCARRRVTLLEVPPVYAADLVTRSRTEGRLPDCTAVRVGGARVPFALRRALLAEVSARLYVSYGTTETSFAAIADPAMHDERETVGPAAAAVLAEVLRDDGSQAAAGEIGEIRLRAPGMASAYVDDPVATARHFRDGWFVPGDLASLDADGRLYLHGRKDDMMIMNGINIFPLEIERTLEAHPAVGAVAAFPIPSAVHGQIPAAAVELREGSTCTASELVGYARGALGVRAPRRIEIVAALPRNAQGKVVKREIVAGIARREGG
jgi:acyl-CoA synthetase (AMP-forming)/AMP-acid ligase II